MKFTLVRHEGVEHLAVESTYCDEEGAEKQDIETVASFCHGAEWDFIKAITALLNKHGHELD